ncbi:unnamed protein product [Allacma fusca]|uniref:Uncharacterized protein n=1 Tax=Allacma fusca TaxID=39272 RepID=A0A8J2J7E1_9HEXA|nr:unnamed protein product [Allacma fusca]
MHPDPVTVLTVILTYYQTLTFGNAKNDHLLMSDQLCPNPITNLNLPRNVNEQTPKVVTVNSRKNTAWRKKNCVFSLEDESRVLIRAISSSSSPWNYSHAQQCDGMIQISLQLEDSELRSNPKQWCKIERWKNNTRNWKFFNPQLWLYPKNKFGIYFSTEWNGSLNTDSDPETSKSRPRFLQFAFNLLSNTAKGKKCMLKVQQYAINQNRLECQTWEIINQNCGVYDCSHDQVKVLERMNFSVIQATNQSQESNETSDLYLNILNLDNLDEFTDAKREQLDKYLSLVELIAFVLAFFTGVYLFLFSYVKQRKLSVQVEETEGVQTCHHELWDEFFPANGTHCNILPDSRYYNLDEETASEQDFQSVIEIQGNSSSQLNPHIWLT